MSANEPLIQLQGLKRHYRMGDSTVRALDGVDLSIDRGEFVMIVGSSGSGKSTLMHVLGCLDTPTEGAFMLDGQDIANCSDEELSRLRNARIGFVFQQFNLLSTLTVVENVAVPLVYAGLPRAERLEVAADYATRMGLQDRLTHRPTELSGGQSQRVAIARALANDPDILFADEPTGNLDSKTGRQIMNELFALSERGYTVIMVTHDAKLAEEGTRKITLRDGLVVDDVPGRRARTTGHGRTGGAAPTKAHTRMPIRDLLRLGIREGLLTHKTRTALTMLGVIIGVAGVIAMSSFSLGSKEKQANQIRALGANLMRVVDARLEGERLSDARIKGSKGLSLKDMRLIGRTVPGIARIAASREIKLNMSHEAAELSPRILGVSGAYREVNNLRLAQGRFLDERDEQQAARVLVLGATVAEALGGAEAVGRQLSMGGVPYTVVGVLANRQIDIKDLEASGGSDANYDILMPLNTVLTRTKDLPLRSQIDELHIQLHSEEELYASGTSVRRLLNAAHRGVEDFQLVVPLDLLKQKQQAQRLLDILTICVSSISLLVGGIGIMNIMLASVTERIREIGIRRAVGATRHDVMSQFLSEAVIISVTGGIAGIGLAGLLLAVTCAALDLPIVISPLMVTVSVLAATGTGVIFGLYPAREAARKDPVEALRYE